MQVSVPMGMERMEIVLFAFFIGLDNSREFLSYDFG